MHATPKQIAFLRHLAHKAKMNHRRLDNTWTGIAPPDDISTSTKVPDFLSRQSFTRIREIKATIQIRPGNPS